MVAALLALVGLIAIVAAVAIVTRTVDELAALVVREAHLDHHHPAAAVVTPSVGQTAAVVTPTYRAIDGLRGVMTDVEDH